MYKRQVITLTRGHRVPETNDTNMHTSDCSVGEYSAIPYTENMHMEWKIVTNNPQVTRKLTEFAQVCCVCNTRPKLVLRTSVTSSHVTCEVVMLSSEPATVTVVDGVCFSWPCIV